ncbi:MAG: hypothetical protein MK101_02320 [Phycisphaerales bacterium]|nr:hypothetical protein [Phycisphaerales bacterium]
MTLLTLMVVLCTPQAPMVILGPVEPVGIRAITEVSDAHVVVLRDHDGEWAQLNRPHPILVVSNRSLGPLSGLRLHLRSGEAFPGTIEATSSPDMLAWRHPWLGRLEVSLDSVCSLGRTSPLDDPDARHDVIELEDGDRLEGFCASIGPEVVIEVLLPDGSEHTMSIPWRKIRSLRLADSHRRPPVGCSAFSDGTVAKIQGLRRGADDILRHAPHPLSTAPGIGAPAQGWAALALGDVVPLGEVGIEPIGDALEGPSSDGHLFNTGPVRLVGLGAWKVHVPEGMSRLRAQVHVPPHLRHLSGGALSVEADGVVRAHVQLGRPKRGEAPMFIDVEIAEGNEVIIRRTGGPLGEVGATVELTNGVLIGPPTDSSTR